jgi:hypothetical protein
MFRGRTTQDHERWRMEVALVQKYFPGFTFHRRFGRRYVIGWLTPNGSSRSYKLQLDVPPKFPHQKPRLFVISPVILWKYGGRQRINDLQRSHSFHAGSTGPDGCCEICYVDNWDASMTLVRALLAGALWCEAYTMHLSCGDDIDTCLKRLRVKARSD